ncbi:hypothetical protein [Paenibacillus sp. Soil787]|uniref:hypothetical protein n=1 Tax=Paenibacillus sp. Soil787 TaxID=1736411 RepID=UPI000703A89C|nr:hypothetical protein [Paenibacillus sp. Soil787]KRF10752.1 hypothetical protein ASG93_17630 [Paenibacillus sp. Soil787]
MNKFIKEEISRLTGKTFQGVRHPDYIPVPMSVEARIVRVSESLARFEQAFCEAYPTASETFSEWFCKSNKLKDMYVDALLKPIEVLSDEVVAKARDARLAHMGNDLATPLTMVDSYRKRSFSPDVGKNKTKGAELVYCPNGYTYGDWIDKSIAQRPKSDLYNRGENRKARSDGLQFNDRSYMNPEELFLAQEERQMLYDKFSEAGFTQLEIDAILIYEDNNRDRGTLKHIQEDLGFTRGKLQYLIKRLDKFLGEIDYSEAM